MHVTINTPDAPAAIGPYSQGVRTGDVLYCSGQLGCDPAGGEMREGVKAQAEQALRNLDAVCREAGTGLSKALRCTIYLTDMADFAVVNEVYGSWFEAPFPARACVQVAGLPKAGLVEIDAIVAL
ncbi:MAG: RidA family protein [Planctomycetota bacterium]|jgi:2-iminobutanoate/2-iminopropanoate deaminase|nr:RidA family protein [Planctomycetota bacterium]